MTLCGLSDKGMSGEIYCFYLQGKKAEYIYNHLQIFVPNCQITRCLIPDVYIINSQFTQ
jgi:hypothetical protein